MPYEALIFDVGGVIVPHDNALLFRRLAARCAAEDALERIRGHHDQRRVGTGELAIPELHRRLQDELGYAGDWRAFQDDWSCHLGLDRAMLEFVEGLAKTRRVALFSNTNAAHWAHVEHLTEGRIGAFELYLSHELGLVKPELEAFRAVAARMGVDPARCLFIDDVMANVEAARRAGFQAELFTSKTALAELLSARGALQPELQTGDRS